MLTEKNIKNIDKNCTILLERGVQNSKSVLILIFFINRFYTKCALKALLSALELICLLF
jgi:hypothetical protein